MVTKPDFSKERKEYQEVEAILRRRALLSLLAMALQSSLVTNFNLPAFLKIFFIIMYIVQGLVLGMCVFLSWYQKYKLKRLTQGRELWYFWARLGDGIQYYFVARTRKTRAKRRAYDKAYETSVQTASKIDRIDQGVSNVEDGILVQMVEKDRAIQNLNEDKSSLIKANADLQVSNSGLIAENDAVKLQLERTMAQYEEEKTALLASIGKITATHERQQRYIQEKLDALEAQKDVLLKEKETKRAEYAAKLAEAKGVADLEIAFLQEKLNQIMAEKDRKILELESEVTIVKANLEDITAKYKAEADAMVAKTAELNMKIQEATDKVAELEEKNKALLSESSVLHEAVSRKITRRTETIDEILRGKAKEKSEVVKTFLLKIHNEDKYMSEGYAVRLVKFYQTMLHMGYIENNLTAYAKFFFDYSESKSLESYIRTFRNSKDRTTWTSECVTILQNLLDS